MSKLLSQVSIATIYLAPVQFCLGISTNALSIWILRSRALCTSPCTHYFLAYAIFSIMYTIQICPTQMLSALNLDWRTNPVGCKMRYYIIYIPAMLAEIMIMFASFDRYCSSSNSLRLRSTSTIRRARLTIIIATISMCIYLLPVFIIYNWNESTKKCQVYSDLATIVYLISQIFLIYILTPILLITFGSLTVYNIRQSAVNARRERITVRGRRTESQLARMLILQIGFHLIFSLPFGIIFCMNSFVPSTLTPNITAIREILVLWQQCNFFSSFFLYVVSGKVYREQLIRLLKHIKCRNAQVHSNTALAINVQYTRRVPSKANSGTTQQLI